MYRKFKINKVTDIPQLCVSQSDTLKTNNLLGDVGRLDRTRNKIGRVNNKEWSCIRKYTNIYEHPVCSHKEYPISRAFYKLWELLCDFHINCNGDTLHLCEAPGGFIQACLEYKSKMYTSVQKCHTISLVDSNDHSIPKYNYNIVNNKYVNIINNKNGDLCDIGTIISLSKLLKNKPIKFITADGGITENGDYNNKEPLHIKLIIAQVFVSLLLLEKGGDMVLKIFDIHTNVTSHIIYLLSYLFTEVYITKPLTSRPTNSEKYLVCKGYIKGRYTIDIKNSLFNALMVRKFVLAGIFKNIPPDFMKQLCEYNKEFIDYQVKCIEYNLNLLNKRERMNKKEFDIKKKIYNRNWLIKYKLINF